MTKNNAVVTEESVKVAKVNKVTITIEGDGKTTVITIPQAEGLDIVSSPIPIDAPHEMGEREYHTDRANVKLELLAIFDEAYDFLYAVSEKKPDE